MPKSVIRSTRAVLAILTLYSVHSKPAIAAVAAATSELSLTVSYSGPAGMLSFGPTPSEGVAGPGAGAVAGFGSWSANQGGEITRTVDTWNLKLFADAFASSPPDSQAAARRKAMQGVILSVFVDPIYFDTPQIFSLAFGADYFASASASGGYARANGNFSINAFYESSGDGLQFFPSLPLEAAAPPSETFSYNYELSTIPLVLDPGYRYTVTLRRAEVGAFAAVPDLQTWTMMILGFGLVGITLRNRHNSKIGQENQ